MNLFLHGVEAHIHLGDSIYEPDRGERYDVVLTNPPFGTKGANQAPDREDFTIATSSKQLIQKGRPTEEVWILDARSNVPGITKKDRPLTPQHFAEFEAAYGKDPNGRGKRKESERFRRYPASPSGIASTNSTSRGSKTSPSKTVTNYPSRRTWPAKPSPSLRPSWMTCATSWSSWRRRRA